MHIAQDATVMSLTKHQVFYVNPYTLRQLKDLADEAETTSSEWLRSEIRRTYAALHKSGSNPPPPLGEFKGNKTTKRQLSLRLDEVDRKIVHRLASMYGVSISKLARDLITQAHATSSQSSATAAQ
jgi:hypothetical protein